VTSIKSLGGKTGNRMYRNDGTGVFTDATDHANVRDGQWGWGASMQDFNNDGWLDIYHDNGWQIPEFDFDKARMFVSNGNATFTEMAAPLGLAHDKQGRGVACFDYDRDGDIDIFVANCDQNAILFRNDGGNASNWLDVKLVGPSPNVEQIGARVTAVVGSSRQMWEIRCGNNFNSQDPAEVHFGLASAATVDSLIVRWTDGSQSVMTGVPANQRLVLNQSAVSAPLAGVEPLYRLAGAEPNPFRAATAVRFDLASRAFVDLSVFDVGGRLVRTLVRGEVGAGSHRRDWDGRDASGRPVASGTYFVRLNGGEFPAVSKVVRID
jgi:hypothetical protein